MDGKSLTPQEIKLQQLKEILPEAFAEGKVDWEKLKATLGEDINFANERYVLNWAGKSEAFKVLQAPTTKTLVPDKEQSVNFDETENIFIEGENLEVLKVLQKSYFGKVKMIYIDPPYNTGKDSFIYPDKFSETKAEYQKRVGDKDEDGYLTKQNIFSSFGGVPEGGGGFRKNSKENGQYHSNWLNMMYPRLFLAKNLLKQDGVIFISIDDNEVMNLRLMMNEVFGEENFVANIVWLNKEGGGSSDSKHFRVKREFILCYGKSKDLLEIIGTKISNLDRYKSKDKYVDERGPYYLQKLGMGSIQYSESLDYPIKVPDDTVVYPKDNNNGKKACWRWSKKKLEWGLENGFVEIKKDSKSIWTVYTKQYLNCDNEGNKIERTQRPYSVIKKFSSTQASKYLDKIGFKNYFDYTKPIGLIQYLIDRIPTNGEIVMDFFSGSGTTAHAVMALNAEDGGNRKCISVQLPEQCDEKSEAYKAGYKTIADIAKERIRRAGKKIQEEIKQKIKSKEKEIQELESQLDIDGKKEKINNLKTEIEKLKNQDLGFKVLKLSESNFKQWQQITGNDAKALEEQMELFVDPVSENATIENMVYELLLKSGKDLNSKIFPSSGGVSEGRGGNNRNSKNYFNLPYNPKLKERAKELRKAGNLSEVLFWQQVKNKKFKGYDFDRQKIIGNYIVDFYCTNCNVIIEIDGSSHDDKQDYDAKRDKYFKNLGLEVIHINDLDIKKNLNGVMEMLLNHLALKEPPRQTSSATPPKEGNYIVINDNELIFMLEKATQKIVDAVIKERPQKVIALDKLFKDNDQLKTNTSLQMRDAGIEFKTI